MLHSFINTVNMRVVTTSSIAVVIILLLPRSIAYQSNSVQLLAHPAKGLTRNINSSESLPSSSSSLSSLPSSSPSLSPSNTLITSTTTDLGSLIVPKVGVGTISWTASKDNRSELQTLVSCHTSVTSDENNNGPQTPIFFDTAERYGSNLKAAFGMGWGETETLIRDLLLEQHQQLPSVVATKFTPSPWRTSVQSVVDACQDSCRRLGVEAIDLYQLHMPDIVQPMNKIIPDFSKSKDSVYWYGLIECYHRGLIKNVGVCNYGPTLLSKCQQVLENNGVPLVSNQIAYSILGQQNTGVSETIAYCNENNLKVLAFFPFAMGLLTGKYTTSNLNVRQHHSHLSSLRTSKKSFFEDRDLQMYVQQIEPLILAMEQIAIVHEKTISQVAINYIICQGIIPIPGARTKEQYLNNMGSIGWSLSPIEIQLLNDTVYALPNNNGFHGAGFKRTSEKFVGYGMEEWSLN